MRLGWMACTALAACMIGPMAVADATANKAVRDLLDQPQVCGPGGSAIEAIPTNDIVMVDGFGAAVPGDAPGLARQLAGLGQGLQASAQRGALG